MVLVVASVLYFHRSGLVSHSGGIQDSKVWVFFLFLFFYIYFVITSPSYICKFFQEIDDCDIV